MERSRSSVEVRGSTRGEGRSTRRPWEEGQRLVPEAVRSSFFTLMEGTRYYIDVVALGESVAIKLAAKTASRRAFIRAPARGFGELAGILSQVLKDKAIGKAKEALEGRFKIGIFDEGGRLVCKITEYRGTSILGSVVIPQSDRRHSGWNWLLDGVMTIKRRLEAYEGRIEVARTPPISIPLREVRVADTAVTPMKSYADAVQGGQRHEDPCPVSVQHKDGILSLVVEPHFTQARRDYLACCIVARTRKRSWLIVDLQNLVRRQWKLAKRPEIHIMGTGIWLMHLESLEEKNRILTLAEELKEDVFTEIDEWKVREEDKTKQADIAVEGIPAHLWCSEVFEAIVGAVGRLVHIEEEVLLGEKIDCFRAKIEFSGAPPTSKFIQIRTGDETYSVRMKVITKKKGKSKNKKKKLWKGRRTEVAEEEDDRRCAGQGENKTVFFHREQEGFPNLKGVPADTAGEISNSKNADSQGGKDETTNSGGRRQVIDSGRVHSNLKLDQNPGWVDEASVESKSTGTAESANNVPEVSFNRDESSKGVELAAAMGDPLLADASVRGEHDSTGESESGDLSGRRKGKRYEKAKLQKTLSPGSKQEQQ